MQQTLMKSNIERKPRSWLIILDVVFYVAIVAALAGLAFYLYQYRDTISLYIPVFRTLRFFVSLLLSTLRSYVAHLSWCN